MDDAVGVVAELDVVNAAEVDELEGFELLEAETEALTDDCVEVEPVEMVEELDGTPLEAAEELIMELGEALGKLEMELLMVEMTGSIENVDEAVGEVMAEPFETVERNKLELPAVVSTSK